MYRHLHLLSSLIPPSISHSSLFPLSPPSFPSSPLPLSFPLSLPPSLPPSLTLPQSGLSPIHVAAYNDQRDVVELLLINKACEVNTTSRSGETALHIACLAGHLTLARWDTHTHTHTHTHTQWPFNPTEVVQLFLHVTLHRGQRSG